MPLPHRLIVLAVSAALAAAPARAATILADSFDQIVIEGSGQAQRAESAGNQYRTLSGSDIFDSAAPAAGKLGLSGKAYVTTCAGFPLFTLAKPGDSLTATFTVQYPQGALNTNSALRLGLYAIGPDAGAARGFHPTDNPGGDKAAGYYLTTNPGADDKAGTALGKDLANQKALSTGNAVNGGSAGSTRWLRGGDSLAFGPAPQTITLAISRTVSGVTISGGPDGRIIEVSDSEQIYTAFDSLVISVGAPAGPLLIDDLVVAGNPAP